MATKPTATWNAEADRDLLLAIAVSENGKKPTPKWEKVAAIMKEWGYSFTSSAMYQHFNKKIWREAMEGRSDASPKKTSSPSTPRKRGRKNLKAEESPLDSGVEPETPSKKRKIAAENGPKEDGNIGTPVKKEIKDEGF